MKLSDDETVTVYNCVATVMRGFRTAPAPWAVRTVFNRLNSEVHAMSARGRRSGCGSEESETDDPIGSAEAAKILGCDPRHVRRLRNDLEAKRCGRDWIFQRQKVIEYAEGRSC